MIGAPPFFLNQHKMIVTETNATKYANWILRECSCPVDEITWLVSTILESDNNHVIKEVFENMIKHDKL